MSDSVNYMYMYVHRCKSPQVKSVIGIRNYMQHNNILDPHGFVAFDTDQGSAVRVCSTYLDYTAYEYAARAWIIWRTSMQYVP